MDKKRRLEEDDKSSKRQKTVTSEHSEIKSPPRTVRKTDLAELNREDESELTSPPRIPRKTDLSELNNSGDEDINELKKRLEVLQTEKTHLMVKLDRCIKDKCGEISKLESRIVELDSLINPLDDQIFEKELEKSDGRKRRSKTKRRSKAKRSLYGC